MLYIVDTSTLIHSPNLLRMLSGKIITSDLIIKEVKDFLTKIHLDSIDIEVIPIEKKDIDSTKEKIVEKIPLELLSDADISLIYLAIKNKDKNPIVLTDDTKLQNVLAILNINYKSLRGIEIKTAKVYKKYCKYCKKFYKNWLKVCPTCGKSLEIKIYRIIRRE